MEDLFAFQTLRIEQPGKMFADRASYQILDDGRRPIAIASEIEGHGRVKLIREAMLEDRFFEIVTPRGTRILSLVKRTSEWSTDIHGPDGELVGRIRTEATKRHYTFLDEGGQALGQAAGDLGLKRFLVTNSDGGTFARVQKTWAGLRKEMLTSSDHYRIEFIGPVSALARTLTVMMPIVLDLTSYEPV